MIDVSNQLDSIEKTVISGLKDFQVATVNRIDHLYRNKQRRVLVSDEVGLGKTLIARGVVAKMAKLRKEEGDDLFKVVYICSNAAIADQNLGKLRITSEARLERVSSSRLTMQHLSVFNLESDDEIYKRYIQLIPLTPDTSLRMTNGRGIKDERALMFALLRRLPELSDYVSELEGAMKVGAVKGWNDWCRDYYENEAVRCNENSNGKYFRHMTEELERALSKEWKDGKTYMDGIKDQCEQVKEFGIGGFKDNGITGQLRVIFAKISLDKLEPDLVIMDEFQRFKYLLDSDSVSETSMLAKKFFHSPNVRMLLLSATPYKMYSTPEEIDESRVDEHYTEFFSVMDFLNENPEKDAEFRTVWKDYSVKLRELTIDDTTVLAAKDIAENAMYQTICRTERVSANESADIIKYDREQNVVDVLEQDIQSYMQAQELLDQIGQNYHVPVDYVKSTPYLMSFMREYKLKRDVESYFKKHPDEIEKINKESFWLQPEIIDSYGEIPNNNARLEHVMKKIMQQGVEKLLWMPPSRPYYELGGVFKDTEGLSKTLVFSSWEMVPRMLACLVSYEAERRTTGKLAMEYQDRDAHYFFTGEKRYPPARLNFSVKNDQPSAMSLFCLIYPSRELVDSYDPIACMNDGCDLNEIRRRVRDRLVEKLSALVIPIKDSGTPDRRWYYMAPLLLDPKSDVMQWHDCAEWTNPESGKENAQKGFKAHIGALMDLYLNSRRYACLGRQPDDLLDVLTDMAIASPAVCIKRTYERYIGKKEIVPWQFPSQLARVFINRMNTVESTAVVEVACGRKSEDAHWRNLLTYCEQGNLQAVFDEYAHLICSGLDFEDGGVLEDLHRNMMEAMNIRTTNYTVDTFQSFEKRMQGERDRAVNIRSHFAVAFTKGDGKDEDYDRKKVLRNAFNSPFRPFVLATTSIGQEGLDFHKYCRKIVHWNLPSNPIDLEQREGRINRFECLAIRQNVAKRYGNIRFFKDIWDEMFEEASRKEKVEGSSDLIPYWGLRESEDMVKIERIVPMYPFSRDELAYDRLIKILSLYRLTLGQARQEELLEYFFDNDVEEDKLRKLFMNLSPFYKGESVEGFVDRAKEEPSVEEETEEEDSEMFPVGCQVSHKTFGNGIVRETTDKWVMVQFDGNMEIKVNLDMCVKDGLMRRG